MDDMPTPHNVDDLLTGSNASTTIPDAPEVTNDSDTEQKQENHEVSDASTPPKTPELSEYGVDDPETEDSETEASETEVSQRKEKKTESAVDEYGNEKPPEKMYTDEEVKERINAAVRERLARLERNSEQQQQQAQKQAQKDFEYDENSSETWQQQLESFIEQTHEKMYAKRAMQSQQAVEAQNQAIFEEKFKSGMEQFKDFAKVVGKQPITDAMTLAARGIADPAAFFYAAAKRMPDELSRISKIADPYAQIAEIGKLEVKLKKPKDTTKTPKPVSKTKDDMQVQHKSDKKPTIEDLIRQSEAKKLQSFRGRRSRR